MGPVDEQQEDHRATRPAFEAFVEACRHESLARPYLNEAIDELKACAMALRSRWELVQESLTIPSLTSPERGYPDACRPGILDPLNRLRSSDKRVLSVDVFDTCLVRLVSDPLLVFRWAGLRLEGLTRMEPGLFAAERQRTEEALRARVLQSGEREDILLEEIYEALGAALGWDERTLSMALHVELDCERALLRPVTVVRDAVWRALRAGQEICYTSEMYLRAEVLRDLLREAGFPVEGSLILTSGETGKSKGTGNIYRLLCERHSREAVIHVGDNPATDIEVPLRLGIESIPVQAPRIAHAHLLPAVMESVLGDTASGGGSPFERLGHALAGPLHFAYAVWLYRRAQTEGVEAVYFLSRDGWFTKQVFDELQSRWGSVVSSQYLYASREMLGLASMETIEAEDWEFLLKPAPGLRTRDFFDRLRIPESIYAPLAADVGLPSPDERICHHWGFFSPVFKEGLYRAICSCLPSFLNHRTELAISLRAYYSGAGLFSRRAMFVDLGWAGSTSRSLRRLAGGGECPRGAYFALFNEPAATDAAYFYDSRQEGGVAVLLQSGIALMEFLFGSPQPTVSAMWKSPDGWRPQFRGGWAPAQLEAWAALEKGIMRYTAGVLEGLPSDPGGEAHSLLERLLQKAVFSPEAESLLALSAMEHGEGWGTDHRLRFLPRWDTVPDLSLQLEGYCLSPWRPGLAAWIKHLSNQEKSTS
jgi:hypothetical protein